MQHYESLASGWPAERSVQRALQVFMENQQHWGAFGVPSEAHAAIRKQLQEAPVDLFFPTLTPTLNVLQSVYESWLQSQQGVEFIRDAIGVSRQLHGKAKAPAASLDSTDDYLSGW